MNLLLVLAVALALCTFPNSFARAQLLGGLVPAICACSAGTYCAVVLGCAPCDAGTSSEAGSTSCTLCPANTYSERGGLCTACPDGSTSVPGSSSCEACPAGTFSQSSTKTCAACPGGSISSSGSTECQPCQMGSAPDATQATCTPTSTRQISRRRRIAVCPVGHKPCPVGRNWECVDVSRHLTSCGGCPGSDDGVDCTIFDSIASAQCVNGKCQYKCPRGYLLGAGGCERAKGRHDR